MIAFEDSSRWFLLLLVLLPVVWWPTISRRRRTTVQFSLVGPLRNGPVSWTMRLRHLKPVLRTIAIAVLIVCLARPRKANEETRIYAEGIAIQLVVDRSGSMEAMDFKLEGRPVNRLEAVQQVVTDFVTGNDEQDARLDDLIGLIVFGTYADSLAPLTLDHDHLLTRLAEVEVASRQSEEAATAIGDAVALAVENLRGLERRRGWDPTHQIRSKIIILLTDGENTAGDIEPMQAAEIAASFGIKVYSIGAGTDGMAPVPTTNMFGQRVMGRQPVNIDEETLQGMAAATDGAYFRAKNTAALAEIYSIIGELEKTRIEERRFLHYKELATASFEIGSLKIPALLWIVWALLALEVVLANTRLRQVP